MRYGAHWGEVGQSHLSRPRCTLGGGEGGGGAGGGGDGCGGEGGGGKGGGEGGGGRTGPRDIRQRGRVRGAQAAQASLCTACCDGCVEVWASARLLVLWLRGLQ